MPNLNWSKLSSLQLGRYAEYYAKMEFSSYGFEVYTSEVDDHGVDFIAKSPSGKTFYEVQVKSVRDYNPTFIVKDKMELVETRLVCYLRFSDGALPDVFVIPATAWKNPNAVLTDKDYGCNQVSKPEWGIHASRKNYTLLEEYQADVQLQKLV